MRNIYQKIKQVISAVFAKRITFTYDGIKYTVRHFSLKKLINWIMNEWAAYTKPLYPWEMPKYLQLEPTNLCNLHCPGCILGQGHMTRIQGKMSLDEYKKIVDQLKDYLLLIILFERGEPFLHENIFDMTKYACQREINVTLSTNGHFLNSLEQVESIVHSGLNHLTVSLDGATPETYKVYRRGGDFNKVISGIRTLCDIRNKIGFISPQIELQFIPTRYNEHEIPLIRELASNLGVDILSFKTYNPAHEPEDITYKLLPKNEKYRRFSYNAEGKLIRNKKNLCTKLWNTICIHWNGDVVPCCYDHQNDFVLGSIKEQTISEIWRGAAFAGYRKDFRDNWSSHPLCNNCTYAYMKPGLFTGEMIYGPKFKSLF